MIDDLLFPPPALAAVLDTFLLIAGGAGAIAALLFVITYSFYPWRSTTPGRSLMYLLAALMGMFSLGVLTRTLGPLYPGRHILTLTLFVLVVITVWRLLVTLWRHNRVLESVIQPFTRTTTTTTVTVVKDEGDPTTTTTGPTVEEENA